MIDKSSCNQSLTGFSKFQYHCSLAMGKQNSKLKPVLLNDLRENTEFTSNEIQKWYRQFHRDYPNGYLTLEEFQQLYASFFPCGETSAFAEHLFRSLDTDNDGWLDFREFIIGLSLLTRGSLRGRLAWAFSLYDIDGNGYITREEMLDIIQAVYKTLGTVIKPTADGHGVPEMHLEKFFRNMDRNGDGMLSLAEFTDGATRDPSIVRLLQMRCDQSGLATEPSQLPVLVS